MGMSVARAPSVTSIAFMIRRRKLSAGPRHTYGKTSSIVWSILSLLTPIIHKDLCLASWLRRVWLHYDFLRVAMAFSSSSMALFESLICMSRTHKILLQNCSGLGHMYDTSLHDYNDTEMHSRSWRRSRHMCTPWHR